MKRIFHTWDKWECYPAGFYESRASDKRSIEQCQRECLELLSRPREFEEALNRVLREWPKSCEHYLSNERMNRIAWLGQAAACITKGVPSTCRGWFDLLSKDQQSAANGQALDALNKWLSSRGEPEVNLAGAGINSKADLY